MSLALRGGLPRFSPGLLHLTGRGIHQPRRPCFQPRNGGVDAPQRAFGSFASHPVSLAQITGGAKHPAVAAWREGAVRALT